MLGPGAGESVCELREELRVLSSLSVDRVCGEVVSQYFLPTLMWFSSCLPNVKDSLCQFLGFLQRQLFYVQL